MLNSRVFSFLFILAAVFCTLCTFSGDSYALVDIPLSQAAQAAPGDGVRRITPAEVRQVLDSGSAVLVDVRGEDSYKAGHVKGARLIPWNELLGRLSELPHDKLIVTYCS